MASMGLSPITLPESPQEHTAQAEAYDRAVVAAMDVDTLAQNFSDLLLTKTFDEVDNPLNNMWALLKDAPLQDDYDRRQWASRGGPGDAALARAVRMLFGEAFLEQYRAAQGRIGDIAF